MKKNSMLHKIAIVVAAVALGSVIVSTDALARSGGGGHMGGGHIGGGHIGGGAVGGHFGGQRFGGGFARHGHIRGFGGPYYDFGSCWPLEYPRPSRWRYDCY